MIGFVRKFWPVVFLLLLECVLFGLNYVPGTWLLGWDTIVPELSPSLNFTRALTAVWQEYRGLGTTDGMAHAANLMHTVYIWILSLALPENTLRYVFTHLTHFLGGVGFYLLALHLFKKKGHALVGALFYMLNLATIQMYFAPLEVFATHFTALPWLALLTTQALKKPTRRNYLLLFIGAFLLTPQGFVPTVFFSSIILVLSISTTSVVSSAGGRAPACRQAGGATEEDDVGAIFKSPDKTQRSEDLFGAVRGQAPLQSSTLQQNWTPHGFNLKTSSLRHGLVAFVIFLAANMFWLLPYLYTAPQTADTIQNTRINQFSSDELFARNRARGDLLSVLTLKGFMLDTRELDVQSQVNVPLMQEWIAHVNTPVYNLALGLIMMVMAFGLYRAVRKKQLHLLPYLLTLCVSFFFLGNNAPLLRDVHDAIRTHIPPLGEAIRIPFTKFGTLYAFSLAIFFTHGLALVAKRLKLKRFAVLTFFTIAVLILGLPIFSGHMYSPFLKVGVPEEYMQTAAYMRTLPPEKRVALLPAHTFWNWQYRTWGWRGSGFLWYGIPQPMLMRAFDPWSTYNEQAYIELSHAFSSEDTALLRQVLDKYDIAYLLLDSHFINSISNKPIQYDRIQRLLQESDFVHMEKSFGDITLFSVSDTRPWVTLLDSTAPRVTSDGFNTRDDVMYRELGDYIEGASHPDYVFPFARMATEKRTNASQVKIVKKDDQIEVLARRTEVHDPSQKELSLPSLLSTEHLIPVRVDVGTDAVTFKVMYPKIAVDGIEIEIEGEELSVPRAGDGSVTDITFTDTEQTVVPGDLAYVLRDYPNAVKIQTDEGEEVLVMDTRDITPRTDTILLPATSARSVKVTIPVFSNPLIAENFIQNGWYETKSLSENTPEAGNCLTPAFGVTEKPGEGLTITTLCAEGGISTFVDFFAHPQSYLIYMNATYLSGAPLQVYVDNPQEQRAELEVQLDKEVSEHAIILPATQKVHAGYGIHMISKSTNNTPSRSIVKEFSVYPFPASFLSSIRLKSTDSDVAQMPSASVDVHFTRLGIHKYIASVTGMGILALSQAFDEGWRAYVIEDGGWRVEDGEIESGGIEGRIKTTFPFFFGKKLQEHVRVNGWANGWYIGQELVPDESSGLVENGQVSSSRSNSTNSTNSQPIQLVIIYWPQYLEYLGFVILLGTFLSLILRKVRRRQVS